jgi:Tfp pilus assembly protein PilF
MRIKLRSALACLLLACAAAAPARAQGSNTLEGRVVLPGGASPSAPVRVTLTYNGRRVQEAFTDLSGRFSFPGLREGTYQLTAEGDGRTFETTAVRADIVAFGGGQSVTQNIQLRPKAGAPAPPGSAVEAEELDPGVPDAAREKYRQGLRSAAENKPEQAVRALGEAVRAHAGFYAAQMALAEQLSKLGRFEEALAAYRKASGLRPDRADPYVGVGVTLVGLRRYDEAIRMLRGVIEVDRNLPAPYLSLGYAEMMTGDHASARAHLLRALELGRATLAHVYLANVYEQAGDFAEAARHLEAYLKENPDSPQKESVRSALDKLRKKAGKP